MPTMIFTMGLPGAGKSTVITRLGITGTVIDPDLIKRGLPGYDPRQPELVHAESAMLSERMFSGALATVNSDWIVDGTGTNSDKMVRKLRAAKAAGFATRLIYVRVSLQTALSRNAARERVVPEYVVREKALDISTAFEIVASSADVVTVVEND